jgi:hypothetical protein
MSDGYMTDAQARKRMKAMIDLSPRYYAALKTLAELADALREESIEREKAWKRGVKAREDLKTLATKLFQVCSSTPHGSRKLAELAKIEYSDLVLGVLKKLREAGKVKFAEGKWSRV